MEKVRFVVLDSETTGLDPRRDRLITLGAVAVVDQEILLGDSFEVLMPIAHNYAAATVHGITRDAGRFLVYLEDGIIVGHHVGHDIAVLNAGYRRHFGFELRNRSLDTMDLTLHLERAGAFRLGKFAASTSTPCAACSPSSRTTATLRGAMSS